MKPYPTLCTSMSNQQFLCFLNLLKGWIMAHLFDPFVDNTFWTQLLDTYYDQNNPAECAFLSSLHAALIDQRYREYNAPYPWHMIQGSDALYDALNKASDERAFQVMLYEMILRMRQSGEQAGKYMLNEMKVRFPNQERKHEIASTIYILLANGIRHGMITPTRWTCPLEITNEADLAEAIEDDHHY